MLESYRKNKQTNNPVRLLKPPSVDHILMEWLDFGFGFVVALITNRNIHSFYKNSFIQKAEFE